MYTSSMAISEYPVSLPIFPIIESCEKYGKTVRLLGKEGIFRMRARHHIGFFPNDKSL